MKAFDPLGDGISLVEYVDHMGSDDSVLRAARVSFANDREGSGDSERDRKLIRYLADHRHGTPFEHTSATLHVVAPIFVVRQWHRHRIGFCLSGDTKISVGGGRNGVTKPIAEIYRNWHEGVPDSLGRARLLPSCRHLPARTANLESGLIETVRMVDVMRSGTKPLIEMRTKGGRSIKATKEHRFRSDGEWVPAGDLRRNDAIGVQGRIAVGAYTGIPRKLREGIQLWTTRMKPEIIGALDVCHSCGRSFPFEELEADHVVPVTVDLRLALDPNNLAPICSPCHRKKSGSESWITTMRRPQKLGMREDLIVSVREVREEMTYDISMPPPFHNFIANGFVVHNSYNEVSRRYTSEEIEFYVPHLWRGQAEKNRQGSSGTVDQEEQHSLSHAYQQAVTYALRVYEIMLDSGVSREQARMVLPQSLYTRMYVTGNLRSFAHFYGLRADEHAQEEIRAYALAIGEILEGLYPVSWQALAGQA